MKNHYYYSNCSDVDTNSQHYFEKLSPMLLATLAALMSREKCWLAQGTIARQLNRSTRQVQRYLDTLEDLGLITRTYRHMTTSLYYVADSLKHPSIKKYIFSYAKSFFIALSLSLLLSRESAATGYVVLEEFKGKYNSYLSKTMGVNTMDERDPFGDGERITHQIFKSQELKKNIAEQNSRANNPQRVKMVALLQKELPLTSLGVKKFQSYPASALAKAYERINAAHNADFPDKYLLGVCENYCKDHNLTIDRSWFNRECSHLAGGEFMNYADYTPPKKETKFRPKNTTSAEYRPPYHLEYKSEPERQPCSTQELINKRDEITNPIARSFLDIILSGETSIM